MIFKVTHLCLKPSGGAMSLGRAIPFFWLVGVCVCVCVLARGGEVLGFFFVSFK